MDLIRLAEVGQKLGYEEDDLKNFVADEMMKEEKEQQRLEREEQERRGT